MNPLYKGRFYIFLFIIIGIFHGHTVRGQDPIFSQFLRSKVYLNPAYTGIDGGFSGTIAEREQWGKILYNAPVPGTFSSQFVSLEWNSATYKNSFGLFFLNDTEGEGRLRTVYTGLNYSYVLPIGERDVTNLHNLRIGFGVYYARKWINDWDKLVFSDQLHPKGPDFFLPQSAHAPFFEDFQNNPPWWTGVNLGLIYSLEAFDGNRLEVGGSYTHIVALLSDTEIESIQNIGTSLKPRFTLHGTAFSPSWQFGSDKNKFTPTPAFRIDYQGKVSAFTVGGDLLFKTFGLGAYYQNTLAKTIANSTDAIILSTTFSVPIQSTHFVDIGLSYDINVNGLLGHTGGVFEITITYNKKTSMNKVICPPVTRAHRMQYENTFHKKQKNKNLN